MIKNINTGNKMIDEIRDVILTVGCKPMYGSALFPSIKGDKYKTKPDFGTL